MASSTLEQEPHVKPIRAERIAQIAQAIATEQAKGHARPTNDGIHAIVGGHRGDVTRYMKQWREDPEAPRLQPPACLRVPEPVAVCAPAPPSTPALPLPHLSALRQEIAQRAQVLDVQRREVSALEHTQAQAIADLRNARLAATRLARRLRQAEMQVKSPAYLVQEDAARQRAQMMQDLAALVGVAEVDAIRADREYRPW